MVRVSHDRSAREDMPGGDEADASPVKSGLIALACVAVLSYSVVVGLYAYWFFGPLSDDPAAWSRFGDYVGGVLNPIFSFLALLGLLWTIALQSTELRLSSRELRNSAVALRAQNETLRLQTFEATFFELLKLHNDIVLALEVDDNGKVYRGRDCFRLFRKRLETQLGGLDRGLDIEVLKNSYVLFYERHQHEVGHYFRLLYNIVKFVHESTVDRKRFYTNLVRAQLSSDELVLIFFNGLSRWGQPKFKPLIEEYGLLKTLPEPGIASPTLRNLYESRAFLGS